MTQTVVIGHHLEIGPQMRQLPLGCNRRFIIKTLLRQLKPRPADIIVLAVQQQPGEGCQLIQAIRVFTHQFQDGFARQLDGRCAQALGIHRQIIQGIGRRLRFHQRFDLPFIVPTPSRSAGACLR